MYNQGSEPGFDGMGNMAPSGQEMGYPPSQPGQEMGYPPSQPGMGPMQPMPQPMMQQPMMQSSNTNTTVVIQQQPAQVVIQGPREWSTGLCACFDDCGDCLLAVCCPSAHRSKISSQAGECCCVATACPIALRTKIRTRHNIAGSIVNDYCVLLWCGPCALCQMARELNLHGI